jgi:hypothetical protein
VRSRTACKNYSALKVLPIWLWCACWPFGDDLVAYALLKPTRAMIETAATPPEREPSLVESVVHVIEAGQRLLLDRLDLARFDLGQLVNRTMRGVAFIAAGTVLLTGACFALMGGAVMWLHQGLDFSLAASCVIVAVVAGGVGASVVVVGMRRTQPIAEERGSAAALVGSLRPPSVAGDGGGRR